MDKYPARHLAVVTCMDTRIDTLGALGLNVGEAHIIRNAGGMITDDVLRSLTISQRALRTRSIMVVHHTDCGMDGLDDTAFRSELERDTGATPTWDVPGFTDVHDDVRASVERVRACPWLLHTDDVRGYVLHVTTSRLEEVG